MGVIKDMIKNWLEIKDNEGNQITIDKTTNFESQAFINNIWYRGDASELDQLYKQFDDGLANKHFWSSQPSKSMSIRKIHTGLPAMIIDTIADISTEDLSNIQVTKRQEEWEKMDKEIKIKEILNEAVKGALVSGDGAFKLSVDTEISEYPILEFYDGERVDFEYERGRIKAIIFKTKKIINKKNYTLLERYDVNGITFSLIDNEGKKRDIKDFPELSKYEDVENTKKFIMAVPFIIYKSKKFKGRGKSYFDNKLDNFDAFDEIWSQWMLAVRKGQ